MFDGLKDVAGKLADKAEDVGKVKDDLVLLYDEANAIMKEITELQKVAMSLMTRHVKVMTAIARLKGVVGLD